MNRKFQAIVIFLVLLAPDVNALSLNPISWFTKNPLTIGQISRSSNALPDQEIIWLSKLSNELKGTEKIGKELGSLHVGQYSKQIL